MAHWWSRSDVRTPSAARPSCERQIEELRQHQYFASGPSNSDIRKNASPDGVRMSELDHWTMQKRLSSARGSFLDSAGSFSRGLRIAPLNSLINQPIWPS